VRLGPYHRVLGVRRVVPCLIACLRAGGICLSHDEVKRAVGLFYGFVWVIASAPHRFLYLNNEYYDKKIKKQKKRPLQLSSFSSAPPPAIEISTPWEIVVRVSSASDLPRPWQLLRSLSRLHLFTFSGAFGLPSRGLWIPFCFRSSSLSTLALVFLPCTPHFATRLA